ncbi:MAG: hypothetical protein GY906_37455 [bacterium]|nr:hypothetical protein [bacterium]
MDDSQADRLRDILKRLGMAIKSSVHDSEDVQRSLEQLHKEGWDGVMALQAYVACRREEMTQDSESNLQVHVRAGEGHAAYRLDASDASFLEALGISPSKFRSMPRTPQWRNEDESPG